MNRSKFIAVIAGFISILICIVYLLLITVLDFRTSFNDFLTNNSQNEVVISFLINFYH